MGTADALAGADHSETEHLATARTADSVRGLLDLAPPTATRLHADGSEDTVNTTTCASATSS